MTKIQLRLTVNNDVTTGLGYGGKRSDLQTIFAFRVLCFQYLIFASMARNALDLAEALC